MIEGKRVSLLVSSRNRPRLRIDAVQSVLGGSTLPDEIIVVNQSDTLNETLAESRSGGGIVSVYQVRHYRYQPKPQHRV